MTKSIRETFEDTQWLAREIEFDVNWNNGTTFEDTQWLAREIEFDVNWNNGTGYFNRAVDVEVQAGDLAKATCPETGRRLLLVGTELGTIVVFERHAPDSDQPYVLVTNCPKAYCALLVGELDIDTLNRIINGDLVKEAMRLQEEETMSEQTTNTTEKSSNSKVKTMAKKAGKGLLYGAGAVAVCGGAYALYTLLKGAGANEVAEAVGEVASASAEAVAEAVAAWK